MVAPDGYDDNGDDGDGDEEDDDDHEDATVKLAPCSDKTMTMIIMNMTVMSMRMFLTTISW